MTVDLRALAREIARELSLGDRTDSARGAPPAGEGKRELSESSHRFLPERTRSLPPSPRSAVAPPGVTFVRAEARIADFIDHTLLKPEATGNEIDKLCDEAREHRFAAVCVNPVWVPRCRQRLTGTQVQLATVIGFPLGANATETKRREAAMAVDEGATELDMVAAIGHIKTGDWSHVADDIAGVVDAARGTLVKVIIESAALSPVEIIKSCAIAKEMRANYVKTATGFHPAGGASAEAVALMRLVVGDGLGVKASGGVRDCETAIRMIASGATRIGTSSGVAMAKCLGTGPLPVRDLLSMASTHSTDCRAGACEPSPAASGQSAY